jgi:hypothetical protein
MNRSCSYCTNRFEVTWLRKDFCSDRCEARYIREKAPACFFCGELVVPETLLARQRVVDEHEREVLGCEEIGACSECTRDLGSSRTALLSIKLDRLIGLVSKRHALDKRMPEWDDAEIEALGDTLRSHVKGNVLNRQRASDRVSHMKKVLGKIR